MIFMKELLSYFIESGKWYLIPIVFLMFLVSLLIVRKTKGC